MIDEKGRLFGKINIVDLLVLLVVVIGVVVVAVTAEPREQQVNMSTSGGTALVIPVNQGNLNLTFTIECNVVNPITSEIGTQEVRVGKNHIVKTDKIELGSGVIIDCEWGTDSETE